MTSSEHRLAFVRQAMRKETGAPTPHNASGNKARRSQGIPGAVTQLARKVPSPADDTTGNSRGNARNRGQR